MRILEAVALGVADYRGALDLIGVAQRSRDLAEFRSVVASGLRPLLDVEMVLVGEARDGQIVAYADDPPGRLTPDALAGFQEFGLQNPCVRAELIDGIHEPVAVSDFLTMREWQRLEIYQESGRHVGGRYQMGAMIGDPGRTQAAVAVMRPTRDFSARDRELLDTVRPHLAWGYEAIRKRTEGPEISAELLAEILPVSPREAEVLACVAQGYTNAEVAQELVISRHTVNKHLERIYDKLRVPNRTAAGAMAHEAINGAAGYGLRP